MRERERKWRKKWNELKTWETKLTDYMINGVEPSLFQCTSYKCLLACHYKIRKLDIIFGG